MSCERKDCFNISIVDDNLLEGLETFNISLSFDPGRGNAIELERGSMAKIDITDNDCKLKL